MNDKLTKLEILELIRRGAVKSLRKAMEEKRFDVPQDLVNMNYMGDSALHVAARYGQVGVLKFLVTDLVGKDGKPFGLDPSMQNRERKPTGKLKTSSSPATQGVPLPFAAVSNIGAGVARFGAAVSDVISVAKTPIGFAPRDTEIVGHLKQGAASIAYGVRDLFMTAYDVVRYMSSLSKDYIAEAGKELTGVKILNDDNATAADIARNYGRDIFEKGERNEVMLYMLKVAEMPAGADRDSAIDSIRNMNVEKFSSDPSAGEIIFRQTLQASNKKIASNAQNYGEIRQQFEMMWERENKEREEKSAKQRKFFSNVSQGLVGVQELKEYLNEFSIDDTTTPSMGSKTMLDIAVENGNFDEVVLFVSGINVGEGENKKTLRLDITDRCYQLLEDALKYNKESEGHLKIQAFFQQVKENGPPEPNPSQPLTAEQLKTRELQSGIEM